MAAEFILMFFAGVSALAYLAVVRRPESAIRSFSKTISVVFLVGAGILADASLLLLSALLLCALGDFCLSRAGERAFMFGIGAFALGHLTYVGLFLVHPSSDLSGFRTMPIPVFAALLVVVGVVMARVLAPRAGELRWPVLIYIPIILSMGLAAMTLPRSGALGGVLVAAGMFVLSDIILAFEVFVLRQGGLAQRLTPFAIWPLYWLAQLGFLLSFS